jgi:ABC-type phosphate transport system substrate-binding protein
MDGTQGSRVTARAVLATVLVALAALTMIVIAIGPTSAGAAPSAAQYQYATFLGDWRSSEPDGSVLTLKIAGAGSSVNVTFTDSIVNGFCAGEMITAKGTGTISGDTMATTLTAKCKKTKGTFGPFDFTFVNNGDGTLTGIGVVWTRA